MNIRPDDLLTRDHLELDELFHKVLVALDFGDHRKSFAALDLFWARLAVHIRAEHLHLFPVILENASSKMTSANTQPVEDVIEQLHADHDFFMKELARAVKTVRELQAADAANASPHRAEVKRQLEAVRDRLVVHNALEESRVYTLVDLLHSPDEAAEIRMRIDRELKHLPPRFAENTFGQVINSSVGYNPFPEGFVLAGGVSSRMGCDKAALSIKGKELHEWAAIALSWACRKPISVVGGRRRYQDTRGNDIAPLADIEFEGKELPHAPIVGVYTALVGAKTQWIAILACDLPFVTGELFERLAGYCSSEFDAVVPIQPDGRPQPLCAFYQRERCLPVVADMIGEADLKMQSFLGRINTRFVQFGEIADLNGSVNFFHNLNRMEDYETAQRIIAAQRTDSENA